MPSVVPRRSCRLWRAFASAYLEEVGLSCGIHCLEAALDKCKREVILSVHQENILVVRSVREVMVSVFDCAYR